MEIWVRLSPKVCQYTILKRHLVQLDGFDANETKENREHRGKLTAAKRLPLESNGKKLRNFFWVLLFSKCSSFR